MRLFTIEAVSVRCAQLLTPERLMVQHSSQPQSISWFQTHYREGRLELRPPFQRKPVWSDKQRNFLIESILLNIPIPEVYVQVTQADDGSQRFGVIDGQQRLRTILQFVGIESEADREAEDYNQFSLEELPVESQFKDATFVGLVPEQRKQFFSYEICVRLIHTDDRFLVEDIFKRLNKFTLPLKPQELRNATYHGAFARLSEELADNDYWAVNRIVSPAAIRRMTDIEMMSDLLIGLLHGPQGGAAKIIDQYYEQYEQYDEEFPDQEIVTRRFEKTLESVRKLFPDISAVSRWSNRADFYSLFVCLGTLLKANRKIKSWKALRAELEKFSAEVDAFLESQSAAVRKVGKHYARAIEKGSNDRARRVDRHEALKAIILPHIANTATDLQG